MFFALCFAIAESYKKELITTQEPRHCVYDNNFIKNWTVTLFLTLS